MQSWNWPAIRKCAYLIYNPRTLKPKLAYNSKIPLMNCFALIIFMISELSDIDWIHLKESYGIRAICFDKDNTLTAPYSQALHFSVVVLYAI